MCSSDLFPSHDTANCKKEVENFYYDMITKRMSAEAAKEQAAAMVDKIAKDYELGKGHLDNENQKKPQRMDLRRNQSDIGDYRIFKQVQTSTISTQETRKNNQKTKRITCVILPKKY